MNAKHMMSSVEKSEELGKVGAVRKGEKVGDVGEVGQVGEVHGEARGEVRKVEMRKSWGGG